MKNKLGEHPNAVVGSTSGAGGGALVVWILSLLGVEVDNVVACIIAGAATGATLLIGRKGFRGIARMLWRGSDNGQ